MRNETFRTVWLKSLKSLRSANHRFRGIVCFQGLKRHFVSPFSHDSLFRSAATPRWRASSHGPPKFGFPLAGMTRRRAAIHPSRCRDEWRSSFDHAHHSTNFLEREYVPCFHDFLQNARTSDGRFGGRFCRVSWIAALLKLNAARQGAVDHEVRSGGKARGGAGEKDDAAADLLRFRHPPGRVQ
jgi:hypothetical protein